MNASSNEPLRQLPDIPGRLPNLPGLSRRGFVLASGAGALGLLLAACGGGDKPTAAPATAGGKNALNMTLPDGAAPAADQYYVQAFDSTGASYKAMDFYETVYSRAPLADQFNIPLVRLNSNYQIVPGAATSWKQTAKTSWTFTLKPGIMWSDGKELTAADYVETMRYSADPKHAWDFSWFWSGVIKNYSEAVAGKVPTNSIGVKQGSDKYSLVFETAAPIAYMPSACLYTTPLSAAALDKYGDGSYNLNPATVVTCGPYTLKTFDPTSLVVLSPNTKYTRVRTRRRSRRWWARSTRAATCSRDSRPVRWTRSGSARSTSRWRRRTRRPRTSTCTRTRTTSRSGTRSSTPRPRPSTT